MTYKHTGIGSEAVDTSGNTSDWVGPVSEVTRTEIPIVTDKMIGYRAVTAPQNRSERLQLRGKYRS